jgi:hypothetical protein
LRSDENKPSVPKEKNMFKKTMKTLAIVALTLTFAAICLVLTPPGRAVAAAVGDQTLLKMKFISSGSSTLGVNILQTGEVNTLSAAVATATLTKVVTGPASGSVYIRGALVEKSTGGTGTFTIQSGTGTNCGTGTAVLLGPVTNPPIGKVWLEVQAPAAKDVCLQTDAATTVVRLLTN